MATCKKETILCLEDTVVESFLCDDPNAYDDVADQLDEHVWFIPRNKAETDEKFRQVIPYVVIMCDRDVLAYTRSKNKGDDRLRSKMSIGFGGHINVSDCSIYADENEINCVDFAGTVLCAMMRELREELSLDPEDIDTVEFDSIGIIRTTEPRPNPSEIPVGNVHLGILMIGRVSRSLADSIIDFDNSDGLTNYEFKNIDELADNDNNLEEWSKLALTAIVGALK